MQRRGEQGDEAADKVADALVAVLQGRAVQPPPVQDAAPRLLSTRVERRAPRRTPLE